MKLQDLASVRSGLVLSRKQAKEPSEYRYPLINLRCIQQEGTIQLKEADIYEAKEPLKEEYLSQSERSDCQRTPIKPRQNRGSFSV